MTDSVVAGLFALAAAVITAIVGPILVARSKRKQSDDTRSAIPRRARQLPTVAEPPAPETQVTKAVHSESADAPSKAFVQDFGPRAIEARLKQVPPLSRTAVSRDHYHGRWVRWTGKIVSIRESDSGAIWIQVRTTDGGRAFLNYSAELRIHLLDLLEHDWITFEAEISDIQPGYIDLINTVILEHRRTST